MVEEENKKPEETPEEKDVVWNVVADESELAEFKKRYRRRLIVHLCTALIAALLFGIIVYSGVFDPPSGKPDQQFVKTTAVPEPEPEKKAEADLLEPIRKGMAEAKDKAALEALQKKLADLLNGELKDDPAALKLHFELTEKIKTAAEPANE